MYNLLIHFLFWGSSNTPCSLPPTKKKFIGVRSGERGGHLMLPLLQNQRFRKTSLRKSLILDAYCGGAPFC